MDGFPALREHWLAIEERVNARCKPDVIVVIADNNKDGVGLLNRWKELYPEDTKQMLANAARKAASEAADGSVPQDGQQDPPKGPVRKRSHCLLTSTSFYLYTGGVVFTAPNSARCL